MRDTSISYARKRIEKQIEFQEKERKRKLQATRLELARAGISAYQRRRLGEAVTHFANYIKILEEIKEVREGGLLPTHFDLKKDLPELLMISGVYWDLAKLYDRTRSPQKYKEFLHFVEKYVAFSKGMPFQHLCAEAVRKYLSGDKPVHRDAFKNAYRVLSVEKCFVATAVAEELSPVTLPTLRKFRDEILAPTKLGRIFIRLYYWAGPELAVQVTGLPPRKRKALAKFIDGIGQTVARRRSLVK